MPGLVRFVPGIHVRYRSNKDVDGRDKLGHDENESFASGQRAPACRVEARDYLRLSIST